MKVKITNNQWIAVIVIAILIVGGLVYYNWAANPEISDTTQTQQRENTQGLTNNLATGDEGFTEIDEALNALG